MKHNFDVWTKDEMRMTRREIINRSFLQMPFNVRLNTIKRLTRKIETKRYGLELKAYKYYEYHH